MNCQQKWCRIYARMAVCISCSVKSTFRECGRRREALISTDNVKMPLSKALTPSPLHLNGHERTAAVPALRPHTESNMKTRVSLEGKNKLPGRIGVKTIAGELKLAFSRKQLELEFGTLCLFMCSSVSKTMWEYLRWCFCSWFAFSLLVCPEKVMDWLVNMHSIPMTSGCTSDTQKLCNKNLSIEIYKHI